MCFQDIDVSDQTCFQILMVKFLISSFMRALYQQHGTIALNTLMLKLSLQVTNSHSRKYRLITVPEGTKSPRTPRSVLPSILLKKWSFDYPTSEANSNEELAVVQPFSKARSLSDSTGSCQCDGTLLCWMQAGDLQVLHFLLHCAGRQQLTVLVRTF